MVFNIAIKSLIWIVRRLTIVSNACSNVGASDRKNLQVLNYFKNGFEIGHIIEESIEKGKKKSKKFHTFG